MSILTTIDGVEIEDCQTVFVVRRLPEVVIDELKVLSTTYDLYRDKGYMFFSSREAAEKYFKNKNLLQWTRFNLKSFWKRMKCWKIQKQN